MDDALKMAQQILDCGDVLEAAAILTEQRRQAQIEVLLETVRPSIDGIYQKFMHGRPSPDWFRADGAKAALQVIDAELARLKVGNDAKP